MEIGVVCSDLSSISLVGEHMLVTFLNGITL